MGLFRKTISIEAQLAALASAGIHVNEGVVEADLTTFRTRAELERKPFSGLIEVLGIDLERAPFTPICDRLWMCDFERIEDHGAYREVVERLERMTAAALQLRDITDHVDLEAGEAWVEFDCAGQHLQWDLRIDDDWLDPQVLVRYDALLAANGATVGLYMNQRDYGQSALLGAFTTAQKARFDELTRICMPPLAAQLR